MWFLWLLCGGFVRGKWIWDFGRSSCVASDFGFRCRKILILTDFVARPRKAGLLNIDIQINILTLRQAQGTAF